MEQQARERPENAEVQACTALVAIEIGAKERALTFSAAALSLDPGNATWAWIRGRAEELEGASPA